MALQSFSTAYCKARQKLAEALSSFSWLGSRFSLLFSPCLARSYALLADRTLQSRQEEYIRSFFRYFFPCKVFVGLLLELLQTYFRWYLQYCSGTSCTREKLILLLFPCCVWVEPNAKHLLTQLTSQHPTHKAKMATSSDSTLQFYSKASPCQWSYLLAIYKDVMYLKAQQNRGARKGGPEELMKLDTW